MHLRGAGIAEADVDTACDQCPHQTFRAVHRFAPFGISQSRTRSTIVHAFRQRVSRTLLPSAQDVLPFLTADYENAALTCSLLAKPAAIWPVLSRHLIFHEEENDPGAG